MRGRDPSSVGRGEGQPLWPIVEVARRAGLEEQELELYGRYKAKVHLEVRDRLADRPNGRYIAVTGITPTPLGEGKTVVTLGLAQALARRGRRAIACIRQPSMGPTFGRKGGGAGGGLARVLPLEDVNLHLTGDFHAVGAAHNLLAAAVDAHLFHGNRLGIDPASITLKRVLDVNDRALRTITIGLEDAALLPPRQSGFEITAASEVMAILALATDLADLRARLGRIVVAFDRAGAPVTAEQLRVAGAMAAILRDALLPNLLQTDEHTPVFVHTGPFANLAHGNSSIVADQIALKLADDVITEAGFGTDLGFEKLMDIKCRVSGVMPDCAVIVASVRALERHGAGAPPAAESSAISQGAEMSALVRGCANLARHIQNVRAFGLPVVVAVNRFAEDTPAALEVVRREALAHGAAAAVVTEVWTRGGAGGLELAEAVEAACRQPSSPRYLYSLDAPIAVKVETVARWMYGAAGVDFAPEARQTLARLTELGFGNLPVCVAKTHLSLSHDPQLLGVPSGYRLPVRSLRLAAGAGLLIAFCGDIRTMPGLPGRPAFEHVDLVDGQIAGLG